MHAAILSTKLFIPSSRTNWVLRLRLVQKLDEGLRSGCKLALISAPAGFGKTTLVTEWVAGLGRSFPNAKVAWLSLDQGDNDLAIFLSYLLAALQTRSPAVGEVTSHLLDNPVLPPVDALLLPLVNDLTRLDFPLILVFDDYHTIQQQAIHEALAFLIEHQPPHMQVIITSRQDPLLPLARWRARGLLTDIRLKDLRFLEDETAEFLNRSTGIALQPEDIAALGARTEGWIAGLQLAAVSLMQTNTPSSGESIADFVQSFTGNDRYVMDYLIDEVLSRQPEPVQRFLLHTSVLDRFNAELCEAVVGPIDSGSMDSSPLAILTYLDRANLFLVPLDNHREWYRYHHLFAELLRHRLNVLQGKAYANKLNLLASQWFDEKGYPDGAIAYARSAGDWERCCQLVAKYSPAMMQRGENAAMLRWFNVLPENQIRADALLCRIYGYVLTVSGKLDLGDTFLALAEQEHADDADHRGSTYAFASYNACFRGDFQKEIYLARRALSLIPPENMWARGVAAISLGLGLCHIGDPYGCESAMHEALAAGQKANAIRTCVHAFTYLGRMSVLHLEFSQAERYFQQAIQYRVDHELYAARDIPIFDLAQLMYEQNDLNRAFELTKEGLEVNQHSGNIEMRAYGYRLEARLLQLKGELAAAHESLRRVLDMERDYDLSPLTLSLNAACEMEMAMTEGDLATAAAAAPRVTNSFGLYSFIFYPELARVRLLVEQNKKREAASLLAPAVQRAEQPGWGYPRLQVRLMQALCEDDREKSHQYLREALRLAESQGVLRCFLDNGGLMLALLQELRPRLKPAQSAYADQVLAAFGKQTQKPAQPGENSLFSANLVEPLSDRELEVLRLLADGLTNAEIAKRLYLSPNTLKAHTQNIYSKLDVHSRVQVVNKARDLGLLPRD